MAKKENKVDINELTIGQAKELAALFGGQSGNSLNCMIGKKVIIRTYSAGVWFGTLAEKAKNEVILVDARRLWQWKTAKGISLSAVAVHGVNPAGCRFAPVVPEVWLEAIEIIPCTSIAIDRIEGCPDA